MYPAEPSSSPISKLKDIICKMGEVLQCCEDPVKKHLNYLDYITLC